MSPEEAVKLAHKRGHGVVPKWNNHGSNKFFSSWDDPRWDTDWHINEQRFLNALREYGYELVPLEE